MSEPTLVNRDQKVRIVEEVPGVPATERWFVCGGPFVYDHAKGGYPSFRTEREAASFLTSQHIHHWSVERLIDEFL